MSGRLAEFLTVLVAALAVGGAIFLILTHLQGSAQAVAIIVMMGVVIALFSLLRKRFGRE